MCECIHCGGIFDDTDYDHWKTCSEHPAHIEITQLREEIELWRAGAIHISTFGMNDDGSVHVVYVTYPSLKKFDTIEEAVHALTRGNDGQE